MTTYSSLKYNHPFSSNATGTGSLTLISSQTASASASISFTTGIDSTYDEYVFKFINVHPATDAVRFSFNGSSDSGSNYNVTKTTTFFRARHLENDASTFNYDDQDLAQSTSYQFLTNPVGNDNDECCVGYLHLFEPSSTTFVKHFISTSSLYHSDSGEENDYVGGYFNTTSAINAVDFKFSSGNIDDGTILMYGVN